MFASERLGWENKRRRLLYRLPKCAPQREARTRCRGPILGDRAARADRSARRADPCPELVEGPPPRRHRHRYHGVLAPNARLRRVVTARANHALDGVLATPPKPENSEAVTESTATGMRSAAVRMWAALLARIYEVFPLACPNCAGDPSTRLRTGMRLIAFITERTSAQQILTHLGEPPVAPPLAPPEPQSKGRAPPGSETDCDQPPACDIEIEPGPDINFDQRHGW